MAEKSFRVIVQTPNLPVPMKDIIRGRELILDSLKTEQSSRLFRTIKNDDYEGARACLEAGTDPNARDEYGATPLARAVQKPLPDICALLVRHGADVNMSIEDGITPLMSASMSVNTLVVKCLIGCGANKDAMCGAGKTALALAVQNGCLDNASALLEAGANPNLGDRPLLWAISNSRIDVSMPMVSMLVSHGADCSQESLGTSIFDAFRRAHKQGWEYSSAKINFLNTFLEKKEVRNVLNKNTIRPFVEEFLGCVSSPIGSYLR
jgi:ankyrin repeat protein